MNAMNITDLQSFLAKMEESASRDKVFSDALLEVGTAMADMLGMLEKQGPETAKMIAAALRDIKITVPEQKMPEFKMPDIKVTVPEIKLPEMKMPAPQVTVNVPKQEHRKVSLRITPERAPNGMATSYTITEV